MRRIKLFVCLVAVLSVAFIFFGAKTPVSAVSNLGPDPTDFSGGGAMDMRFGVYQYCIGCGGALEATDSTVVVYLRSTSGTINIINGADQCTGDAHTAPTTFYFYRGSQPLGSYANSSGAPISDSAMNCGTYGVSVSGLTVATVIGSQTFYAVTVRAVHTGSEGSNNFQINGPSGSIVSYYSGSGNHFSIQNRAAADSGNFYSDYNLKFGSDCNITGASTRRLNWFDDDHRDAPGAGPNYNQTAADGYRMELWRTPKAGGTRTRIAYLNYDGTSSGFTALSNGGFGWTGDNKEGWADFTAHPDMQYEWIWYNVKRTNGVQFQVPFNSIYYLYSCGSWDHEPRLLSSSPAQNATVYPGDIIRINGDVRNVGTISSVNHTFDIYPSSNASRVTPVDFSSGGSWVSTYYARWSQGAIGAGSNSADRYARYRVNDGTPAGTQICFRTRVSPDSATASGWDYYGSSNTVWCFTVGALNTWDYRPEEPSGSPADTSTGPKPGQTITIQSQARNVGNDTGPNYRHQIEVRRGSTWSLIYNQVPAGFAPGLSPARSANYTIPADASHGESICFRTVVNNGTAGFGVAGNIRPPNTFLSTSANGPRYSTLLCYSVYNLQYSLSVTAPADQQLGAGESFTINSGSFFVNNDSSIPSNASRGWAPNVSVAIDTTDFTGGSNWTASWNIPQSGANNLTVYSGTGPSRSNHPSFNLIVPPDAEIGEEVCATIRANPRTGYSDGTAINNAAITDQFCVTVSDGPYLQVFNHDTWSGGGYAIGGSCSLGGSGEINTRARSRVASNGTPLPAPGAGAMDEYAAFAQGTVSNFGTSADPLSSLLTFANTPSLGTFGENDRCLANLFDGGGAGGSIDDALWNNAGNLGANFNGFSSSSDGQFRINTSASHNNAGSPFNNFSGNATILIDGNFDISQNITINAGGLIDGDIPFLLFIVTGNINIADSVTRIDGVFISNGLINTCDDGGAVSGDLVADGDCNRHLEVNGSLIGQEIAFRRTYGGTNEAATGNTAGRCNIPSSSSFNYSGVNQTCSAETIVFPPWFWLAEPFFNRGGGDDANQYPIQQLRDLPPIF